MKRIYYIIFSIIITIGLSTICKTEKNKKSKNSKINKKTHKTNNKKTQKNKQIKKKSSKNAPSPYPISQAEASQTSKTPTAELPKSYEIKENDFSKKKINSVENLSVDKKKEQITLSEKNNKTKITKSNIINQKKNTKNKGEVKNTQSLEIKKTNNIHVSKIKEITEKEKLIHNTTGIISHQTKSENKEITLFEIPHKNTEDKNTKNKREIKNTQSLEIKKTNNIDASKIKETSEKEKPIHNTAEIISHQTKSENKEITLSEIPHKNTEDKNTKNQTKELTETQKYMIDMLESIKDREGNIIISQTKHIKNEENKKILLNNISKFYNDEQNKKKNFDSHYMMMLIYLKDSIRNYIVDDNENNRNSQHAAIYHEIDLMRSMYGKMTIDEFTALKENHSENNNNKIQKLRERQELTETQKYMIDILESIKDTEGNIIISQTQHIKNEENKKILLNNISKFYNDAENKKKDFSSYYMMMLIYLKDSIRNYIVDDNENNRNSQHAAIYHEIDLMPSIYGEMTIDEFTALKKITL